MVAFGLAHLQGEPLQVPWVSYEHGLGFLKGFLKGTIKGSGVQGLGFRVQGFRV